jgi:hypothetical protein
MAKFTEETSKRILEALKTTGLVRAAELAGIHRDTFRRWHRQGEQDIRDNKKTELADFVREISKVTANRYAILESSILVAATKDRDWRAGAWLLERSLPDEFGRKDMLKIQLDGAIQGLLDAVEPHMTRDGYAELLSALAKVQGDTLEQMDSSETEPAIQ